MFHSQTLFLLSKQIRHSFQRKRFLHFHILKTSSEKNIMSSIVQYIVVRGDLIKSLNWPLGALIAQCCHAASAATFLFGDDPTSLQYFADLDNMHKVVLNAVDEDELKSLSKTLTENGIKHKLWIEQPENIPTCIAIKPYQKDQVHKFVKKYKLLD